MKDIHFFRAGKHVDSSGREVAFSQADLREIATSYSADLHEAPIVVGHPKDNGPAFGWVESVKVEGDGLHATAKQVNPEFSDLVRQGAYKKVSASFYTKDHPNNPRPGSWYLRHIGFLGAQPPAVKGLAGVNFSEEEGVAFAEIDLIDLRESEFDKRVKEYERNAIHRDVRKVVEEGRLPIGLMDGAIAFAEGLTRSEVFEFSEGGDQVSTNRLEWFLNFLEKLPIPVSLGELAKERLEEPDDDYHPPPGYQASAQRLEVDRMAQEHMRAKGGSYIDAVRFAENQMRR